MLSVGYTGLILLISQGFFSTGSKFSIRFHPAIVRSRAEIHILQPRHKQGYVYFRWSAPVGIIRFIRVLPYFHMPWFEDINSVGG